MNKQLSAIVISLTPFDSHGRLDEKAYRRHLGRLRKAGVSVYVAGSASSEGYTLSFEERDRVLAVAVEELKGHVKVRAMGCEPRLTSEMVEFVKRAEHANVDAAQIFSLDIGHGAKPTKAELESYYSTVLEATSLPLSISSHRAAGYFVPLDLVEKLASKYPHLAGIHYGGPDVTQISEIVRRFGNRLEVHCTGPSNALSVLGLGGNGFMGGEGNFCPELVASVIDAYRNYDRELLREAFGKLLAFTSLAERYGGGTSGMRGVKPLLNAFGLPAGSLRPPRMPISESDLKQFVREVLALEIPEIPKKPQISI